LLPTSISKELTKLSVNLAPRVLKLAEIKKELLKFFFAKLDIINRQITKLVLDVQISLAKPVILIISAVFVMLVLL